MNASIGDGISVLAIAGGIVSYLYFKHQGQQKRIEVIHEERMAAMEKGIPLPEFPLDPLRDSGASNRSVIPILGMVLSTISVGAMFVIFFNVPPGARSGTIAPLPLLFLGLGLLAFHFMQDKAGR